ncbi:hypothetical protein PMAYCL1PPCAC_24616, partial [Pristionchus mayeri]
DFFLRIAMQIICPHTDTVQDSLQWMRGMAASFAGIIYIVGADPLTFSMDIAERRFASLLFHLPTLLIHIFYAVEMYHVDRVLKGRSDNTWKQSTAQKNKWDYGWTYATTFIFGLCVTLTMWILKWDSHQTEYTSFGIVNSNLGMMGCACLAYLLCCTYSYWKGMEIVLDLDRRPLEFTKRDNKYETSK